MSWQFRGETPAQAAALIWVQDNCPDIPIPVLWGLGFPGGQSVQPSSDILN